MKQVRLTKSGVYRLECLVTEKSYVGSSVNMFNRRKGHFHDLRLGKHGNQKLQAAWNKYGESSFVFSVLEWLRDKKNLVLHEQCWIDILDTFNSGYNLTPLAGNCFGVRHSAEVRCKMAMSQTSEQRSEQARRGHAHTDKKAFSSAVKAGFAAMSLECKVKMVKNRLAALSPERRSLIARQTAATKRSNGFVVSDETRRRQSIGLKRAWSNLSQRERKARGAKSAVCFGRKRRVAAGIAWQAARTPEQRSISAIKSWRTRHAL